MKKKKKPELIEPSEFDNELHRRMKEVTDWIDDHFSAAIPDMYMRNAEARMNEFIFWIRSANKEQWEGAVKADLVDIVKKAMKKTTRKVKKKTTRKVKKKTTRKVKKK